MKAKSRGGVEFVLKRGSSKSSWGQMDENGNEKQPKSWKMEMGNTPPPHSAKPEKKKSEAEKRKKAKEKRIRRPKPAGKPRKRGKRKRKGVKKCVGAKTSIKIKHQHEVRNEGKKKKKGGGGPYFLDSKREKSERGGWGKEKDPSFEARNVNVTEKKRGKQKGEDLKIDEGKEGQNKADAIGRLPVSGQKTSSKKQEKKKKWELERLPALPQDGETASQNRMVR